MADENDTILSAPPESGVENAATDNPPSSKKNEGVSIEERMYPNDVGNKVPEEGERKTSVDEEGQKPKDKDKEPDLNDPQNQVPEDGHYDLKMPDGMELDEDSYKEFSPLLKEIGVSRANAQKLTDTYIKNVSNIVAASQAQARLRAMTQWAKDAQSDPEIGGNNFQSSVQSASNVLKQFGSESLTQALNETGMGNHPEMIRLLSKIGGAISEDVAAKGRAPASSQSVEDRMFPPSLMDQINKPK